MLARPVLALLLALLLTACAPAPAAPPTSAAQVVRLTLVAYSTPREAYEEIIAAFRATPAGQGVTFDQSYGSSGEQSRAVASGLPADLVALSLEPDVTALVAAGRVAPDWNQDTFHGMVTDSVVVLVVRTGNPKGIRGWDDLVRPGIDVITPNPFTSGGARWNVLAAYGAQVKQGKTEEQAIAYLRALYRNVSVQDKSAREALQTFLNGKGDVLIAYENEAIIAQQKNQELEYIVPQQTILIENPVAVTTSSQHPEQARAFLAFLRSPEAQRIFGRKGYRPVVKEVFEEFRYPVPSGMFTIADLGGWAEVDRRFFDSEQGIIARVQRERGASRAAS